VLAKALSRRQPSWTQTNRAIYARIFTAANKTRTKRLIPLPNRRFINHAAVINQTSASRNPHAKSIQLFCGIA
jgi:hypothetical protein